MIIASKILEESNNFERSKAWKAKQITKLFLKKINFIYCFLQLF